MFLYLILSENLIILSAFFEKTTLCYGTSANPDAFLFVLQSALIRR